MTPISQRPLDPIGAKSCADSLDESLIRESPSTEIRAEHVHIPTPGDHYSAATGSAIMTIIYEMARVHERHGGQTRVIVARGSLHDYPVGQCVEVDPTSPPVRWQKLFDVGLGRLGRSRRFGTAAYGPATRTLAAGFDGSIFVHNDPVAIPMLKGRLPKATVCLWANNELFGTYSGRETYRIAAAADRLICCSQYIANDLRSRLNGDSSLLGKVHVVHNGVDVHRFKPGVAMGSGEVPVILFVGRVTPVKGPHLLLKAARAIASPGRRFKVRIVGSSGFSSTDPLTDYERELRRLAEPIKQSVEFVPFVNRQRVLEEYQAASIFCVPSDWDDPCPLTVPEGLACGLPTVASRRGGIPELGGDAILYFSPPDTETLGKHLNHLLDDGHERQRLGLRALQRAKCLSWTLSYQTLLKAIEPVCRTAN